LCGFLVPGFTVPMTNFSRSSLASCKASSDVHCVRFGRLTVPGFKVPMMNFSRSSLASCKAASEVHSVKLESASSGC
jgi:hypothetical protein